MRYDTGILAVIVLYKTKLTESKSFLSLSASLDQMAVCLDLVVYDNSPEYNGAGIFERYHNWDIIYKPDTENGGVSKAYNTGAQIAKEMKKRWLLLLDQDTNFPVQTIHEYISSINEYPDEKIFSPIMLTDRQTIISPCYFKLMRGFSANRVETGINNLKKFSIINCGMCIDVDAFNKNDGYNERIKLDFSDHDFIRRFRKSIGDRFIVIDLKVVHALSSEGENSFINDMVRFDYYLDGAKHITASITESVYIKFNAAIRSVKLSLIHHNFMFIVKVLKWI